MADKQISDLTSASGLTDGSLFVLEQGGAALKANWGMMKNYISPSVAPQYSSSATYNLGDYVIYNGQLYRCTTAITTAETWTAAHWTAAVLGDDVVDLKSALYDYNVDDPIKNYKVCTGATRRNVTFAWNADKNVCTMNSDTGASDGFSFDVILSNSSSLCGLKAGEKYYFDISVSKAWIRAELYWYVNGTLGTATYYNTSTWVTVPSNATGILLRAFVSASAGALTNDYLKIMVYTSVPSKQMYDRTVQLEEEINKRIYSKSATPYVSDSSITLSDIKEDGFYLIDTTWTITDKPNDTFSIMGLTVENLSVPRHGVGWIKQTVEEIDTVRKYKKYIRFSNIAGTFGDWIAENAYTLYPTGDTTDRTNEMQAMLIAFGKCVLEPGEYYITSLAMPENSSLIGSGIGRTVVKMFDEVTGSAIKPWTRCSVTDLTLLGNQYNSDGHRYGIGWMGTFESSASPGNTPSNGILNNLYIDGFDGAGIFCRKTSMRVDSGLTASNIVIKHCGNGIEVQQYAEFNQFTNVQATNCTGYGVICNGGNNVFTNCNFSMNYRSLWMKDSEGEPAPNNSHGSFVGCIFDHSGNNDGYAMILYGLDSGEMFVGCQIFYGKTQIENCVGIRFVGCNFGRKTNINIVGSTAIGYSGCMFRSTGSTDTPVTVSTSTGVKFTDCLQYDGSDFNPVI